MSKLSLEDAKQLAAKKKGKCISLEYINSTTPMIWECEKGHQWSAKYSAIKTGTWCPTCNNNVRRISKERLDLHAASHKGKCLSPEYRGDKIRLQWECSEGHIWLAFPRTVLRGTWCPICYKLNHREIVSRFNPGFKPIKPELDEVK